MDLAWEPARARYMGGLIGGAELSCIYIAERVQREMGSRFLQGPRRPALDPGARAPAIVRLFAEREIHRIPRRAAEALVAWAAGRCQAEVWFAAPSARALLGMQAHGRRCVSLLADTQVPAAPIAGVPRAHPYGSGGLGFVIHDLCHLERFTDPVHHVAQVGFFAALDRAETHRGWVTMRSSLDFTFEDDCEQVVTDMNGSPLFLFVVLRSKLKLAVRRQVARTRGEPCRMGPLDTEETRLYGEALEALLDALELQGEARDAARGMTSRRDADTSATAITARFEALGTEALATQKQ